MTRIASLLLLVRIAVGLGFLTLAGCGTNPSVTPYVDGDAGRNLYIGVELEWKI
jgi:hypothetical protein